MKNRELSTGLEWTSLHDDIHLVECKIYYTWVINNSNSIKKRRARKTSAWQQAPDRQIKNGEKKGIITKKNAAVSRSSTTSSNASITHTGYTGHNTTG